MNATTSTAPVTVTHTAYGYEIRRAGKLIACTATYLEAIVLAATY